MDYLRDAAKILRIVSENEVRLEQIDDNVAKIRIE